MVSTFCALYPTGENKVFPVMLLTYMLMLQEFITWGIRMTTEVEQRMVNVDRCFQLLDVP